MIQTHKILKTNSDYEEEITEETKHNSEETKQEASDNNSESDDDETPLKQILLPKTGAK